MKGIPDPLRSAYFEIAISVASPDGKILFTSSGKASGSISHVFAGTDGFGYDPIFVSNNADGLTFAQLDAQRKNLRSHRRKAIRKFSIWIANLLRENNS